MTLIRMIEMDEEEVVIESLMESVSNAFRVGDREIVPALVAVYNFYTAPDQQVELEQVMLDECIR